MGSLAAEEYNRLFRQPRHLEEFEKVFLEAVLRDSYPPPPVQHIIGALGVALVSLRGAPQKLSWADYLWLVRKVAGGEAPPEISALIREKALEGIRYLGPFGDEGRFVGPYENIVLLSALYGLECGRLRRCSGCGGLVAFPRHRWEGKYCENCRALFRSGSRLSVRRMAAYRKAWDRMRKGGFRRLAARLGMQDTPVLRQVWKEVAIERLTQVKTKDELQVWLDTVAPPGRRGRPPKKTVAVETFLEGEGIRGSVSNG